MTDQGRRNGRATGAHRRSSPLRTRLWRVPTKLAAVLTVPLLGFLVVAGVQISDSVRTAADLDAFSHQVALGDEIAALVHELQNERDRSVGMLVSLSTAGSPVRDVAALAPERTAVDRAAARWRTAAGELAADPALAGPYRAARDRLDQVAPVRAGIGGGWLRAQAAFDAYSGVIAALHALLPSPVDVVGDAALGRQVRGFSNLARAKELTAQIRGRLYMLCYGAAFESAPGARLAQARAQRQAALAGFRADADPAQVSRFEDVVAGQAVRNANRLAETIVAAEPGSGVDPQQWWSASTTELEQLRTVEQDLLAGASEAVAAASGSRWLTTLFGSLVTIVLLLAALLMSIVIGRNMASTLRSLRAQALIVAEIALPGVIEQLRLSPTAALPVHVEPIVVGSQDEVAEVAEAFTAVHLSAVRLAAEQASMRRNVNEIFIKLSRRSQTLVERQLQLLDTMESAEVDPDKLGNLFRLDHLAARLRRNDENLLVLAGGDTARHWNRPKDLNTIVLAATAEVEHYQRVHHDTPDGVFVVGHAVADVVNLLAELLENGTAFSPPDTVVQVRGHALADGSAELVVADDGIGMSAQLLAEANSQVSEPVSIDTSAAERMGLVVVGHLARRHGITVHLASGIRGVTVRVRLPEALIAPEPADEPDAAPPGGDPDADTSALSTLRRRVPTRSEDVLTPDRRSPSIWWTRDADEQPATAAAAEPVPEPPALTKAGLPARTRRAVPQANQVAATRYEADPDALGDTLTRLYEGVRRAEAEDGPEAVAATEPQATSPEPPAASEPEQDDAEGRTEAERQLTQPAGK
ncbi:sensor histidine kinase [Catellatospora sichuanensis]|uniref:sensor histidine kinase n=1 Tax=Catellatospora sichuanensis TaxID=1969805 RepID=UPI00118252E2|nr:nitrate- and nitrite sensing domain-containing protein [Catellatospora sichuanensis]